MDGHGGVNYEGLGKTDGECGGFGDFAWEWTGEYGCVVGLASIEREERGSEEICCLGWRLAVGVLALFLFGVSSSFHSLSNFLLLDFLLFTMRFLLLHSHGSGSPLSDDNNDYDTTTYERYNDTINDINNGW